MEKEKSDPFVNLITMYQDKIEELESINDQLMQKYQILLEKYETDYKPQSAESHFAAAKYYFGFRWIERITKEYCELHNYNYISPDLPKEPKTYDEMMMKMGKTLSEMLKENYGTQKEKKRMEDNTIAALNSRIANLGRAIENILQYLDIEDDQNDDHDNNHNDRYSELLTRVQHFYDWLGQESIESLEIFKKFEKVFADFIYIPED